VRNKYGRRSNLIPITRIYDICPKYTYSNDVKKFMDEIVDIDRVNVFTKDDMVDILDKIRAEIERNAYPIVHRVNNSELGMTLYEILQVFDKYKTEMKR